MKKVICILLSLLAGLFIGCDFSSVRDSLKNDTFRIDIHGNNNTNNIKVLSVDSGVVVDYPSWCKECVVLSGALGQNTVKVQSAKDSSWSIDLKGKDYKKHGKRTPVYVGYSDFVVDGHSVKDSTEVVWHDKPYRHKKKVDKGQIVEFSVRSERPVFFSLLKRVDFDFYMFLFGVCLVLAICLWADKFFIRYQNISKHDIIFVFAFIGLLFVPMLHITDAERSKTENRVLATKPKLFINKQINEQYGPQFDTWFNDRFNGREFFINLFSDISYNLNSIYQNNKALLIKEKGWMFGKNTFVQPQNTFVHPKNTKQLLDNLKKFDDFCKQHNIKLYVLLVPAKESVYSDILHEHFVFNYDAEKAHLEFINMVQSVLPGERVLFPYKELKQATTQDYVFFKQAHHWTDYGAYVGYKMLSDRIKKDFNGYNIVSLSDYDKSFSAKIRDDWGRNYNTGHTTNLLGLNNRAKKLLDTEYTYYDSKYADNVSEERTKYTKVFKNKNKRAKHRVFLFGNSQNEDLLQFMAHSVKNMKYLRLNMSQQNAKEENKFMKYYKQELLDYKPDIVVLCYSALGVHNLMQDFYKD